MFTVRHKQINCVVNQISDGQYRCKFERKFSYRITLFLALIYTSNQQNKRLDYYKSSKESRNTMASGVLRALPGASVTNDFHVLGNFSETLHWSPSEYLL